MATVGQLVVKIGADISGFEKGLGTVQARLQSAGRSMQALGSGLTLGLTAPIVGIASAALNSAAGFEKSMNLMQAMSGATGAQMQALSQQALDLGRSTVFSAGEAADAMLELSKAGMSVEQVGGAIPGVLDLAAAANIGLADAATITANTINTFGLEASSAADVANVLAGAANASSADVADLALGMKMAGAVFASNGQSVEEMAASLAILANNGIAGSDAGTSLKVMLMRLAAPTGEAAAAMTELGLNVYDSTGALIPFGDIVGQLESSLAGLTNEQRNAALTTIFGADAIRAATILSAQGAEGFDAMRAAVSEEGAAALLAQANMDGLAGAIQYFKGSIDSLLISTAMPYLDTLAEMVRGAADLTMKFRNLPPGVQRFAAVLTAVLAVGGPLLVLLGTMAVAIGALLSPVGLVIAALVLLGALAVANWGRLAAAVERARAVAQPALEAMQATIDGLRSGELSFGDIGAGLLAQMQALPQRMQAWAGSVDWAGLLATAGDVGGQWRVRVEAWLGEALGQVEWERAAGAGAWVEGLKEAVSARLESGFTDAVAGLQQVSTAAGPVATTLQTSLSTMLDNAVAEAGTVLTTLSANVAPIKDAVVGWFSGLTWDDAVTAAEGALTTLRTTVNGWRDNVLEAATTWVDGVDWSTLSLNFSGFIDRISSAIDEVDFGEIDFLAWIRGALLGPISTAFTLVEWVVGSEKFDGLKASVLGAVGEIQWAEVFGSLGGLAESVFDAVVEAANGVISDLITEITNVDWTALSIDFSNMLGSIATKISEVDWSEIGATVGAKLRTLFVGEDGEGGLAGLATAVYDALAAIEWGTVLNATGALLTSLKDAVLGLVGGAIAGLFGATLEGDGTWTAPQWVTDLQTWLVDLFETPAWVVSLGEWWTAVTATPAWVTAIGAWWDAVTTPPGWVDTLLGWQEWLSGFDWPSIEEPGWLSDVRSWWSSRPWWLGGGAEDAANNAVGTPSWPGGWTTVGEFGPELVRLPAGSRIVSHQESLAMAGAGGRGVVIEQVIVNQPLDLEELRWRLADLTRRRG